MRICEVYTQANHNEKLNNPTHLIFLNVLIIYIDCSVTSYIYVYAWLINFYIFKMVLLGFEDISAYFICNFIYWTCVSVSIVIQEYDICVIDIWHNYYCYCCCYYYLSLLLLLLLLLLLAKRIVTCMGDLPLNTNISIYINEVFNEHESEAIFMKKVYVLK